MTKDRQAILPNQNGFTLVEIMVTLGVMAIIAALATPAIMSMAPNMRLRTATNELHADLMRAKSTAVKMNRNVVFSITTVNCVPAVFDPGGNGGAYRIFVDNGGGDTTMARNDTWNGAHITGGVNYPAEEIVVDINDGDAPDVIENLPSSVAICLPAATTVTNGFTPSGLLIDPAGGTVSATLTSSQGDQYRVNVSVAGSVSTDKL